MLYKPQIGRGLAIVPEVGEKISVQRWPEWDVPSGIGRAESSQ
jgi:hypothetical protein